MNKSKQYSLFDPEPRESDQPGPKASVSAVKPLPMNAQPITALSFDIEAAGNDPMSDTIAGIALCREKGNAYYVPVTHSSGPNVPEAPAILKEIFEDVSISKIGHDLKNNMLILKREGINMRGLLYDTMVASYLLNPNKSRHTLEETALEYLSHKKVPFAEVLGKRKTFSEVPVEEAVNYAAENAELSFELKDILFDRLRAEGLEKLYLDIEMPLIYVLADMEAAGVRINNARLEELSNELGTSLALLESKIYSIAGEEFNINSPKQLSNILFKTLGLQPGKKIKTGFSTGMNVLEELAKTHELPGEILNYRTLYKLKTTYLDALPRLINERTNRIHTSFNQTVTATGRLSSSEPNLQNIPIRGEWGPKIREAFTAEEGHVLISSDYSQIELRVLAHISKDEGLRGAFIDDVDVHSRTASELFGTSLDAVTQDMRRIAKTVNFGVVYGISPYGLSEALDISPREAGQYIDQYFEKHKGVRAYMEDTVSDARRTGYVITLVGRKRPVPEINSSNSNIRQQTERLAINSPIQGTAADLIKIAMINIHGRLKEERLKTRMVLQIHDELLCEAPEDEASTVKDLVRHEMENALTLSVPLKVDIGTGKNWADAH